MCHFSQLTFALMQEAQEDEREVLLSIYDGDTAFKQVSPKTFQYKVLNFTLSVFDASPGI